MDLRTWVKRQDAAGTAKPMRQLAQHASGIVVDAIEKL